MNSAVILVGHGAVASDIPRTLIQRFRALEQSRRINGSEASAEQIALEHQIRTWPRTAVTDPYKAGMDAIAERLRAREHRVLVAFNEFCAPSLDEAIETLVGDGVDPIVVVSTMVTPGGSHSEKDIPKAIQCMRDKYPNNDIRYAWPFDLESVARLLEAAYVGATQRA